MPFSQRIKSLWSHTGFRKYSNNTGWMFFAKLANMLITFIATAYIARHLGPTNYGELSYAVSFVSIFSFIAVLGIDQILYRDLVKHPDKTDGYMGTAFGLRVILGTLSIILCVSIAFFTSPMDVSFFLIILVSLSFIFNSMQIVSYEFQSRADSKYPSILSVIIALVLNILKIVIVLFDQGVIYLASVLLLESILYALGYFYCRNKYIGNIWKWKFDKALAISILKDSWPLAFASAFSLIYARIDQVMIKNIIDAKSVGLYDAAVRLSEVWYFIPGILISSLFPALVNAKKVSEGLYYSRIHKLLSLLIVSSFMIAVPTIFLSSLIINIVYGSAFIEATSILQVYILSTVATAINSLITTYLVNENQKKLIILSSFGGMMSNVVLNIFMIPELGMIGAAYATLISYFVPIIIVAMQPKTRNILLLWKKYEISS